MGKNSTLERIIEGTPEIYPAGEEWAHYFIVFTDPNLSENELGEIERKARECTSVALPASHLETNSSTLRVYAADVLEDEVVDGLSASLADIPGVTAAQADTRARKHDTFSIS